MITGIPDVRPVCQKYYGKDIPREFALMEQKLRDLLQKDWEQEQKSGKLSNWFSRKVTLFTNPFRKTKVRQFH